MRDFVDQPSSRGGVQLTSAFGSRLSGPLRHQGVGRREPAQLRTGRTFGPCAAEARGALTQPGELAPSRLLRGERSSRRDAVSQSGSHPQGDQDDRERHERPLRGRDDRDNCEHERRHSKQPKQHHWGS